MRAPRGAAGHVVRDGGFALLAVVVVLGIMGVLATTAHLVGMDRWRQAWAFRESAAALYAAEAGLEVGLATWDTALLNALPPGATVGVAGGRLSSGDSYRVVVTRVDGGAAARLYVLESIGRSHGARGGRRALWMFVKVSGRTAAVGQPELYLPHPLAQFGWLQILE